MALRAANEVTSRVRVCACFHSRRKDDGEEPMRRGEARGGKKVFFVSVSVSFFFGRGVRGRAARTCPFFRLCSNRQFLFFFDFFIILLVRYLYFYIGI